MNLTLPDWLAILSLVVGLVGGVLGMVGLALTIWLYREANQVNAHIIEQQTKIAETTAVLKTLVDGLLGTTWAHVARQNEVMVEKLMALQASVANTEKSEHADSGSSVEVLARRYEGLAGLVEKLTDYVLADAKSRPVSTGITFPRSPIVLGSDEPTWARGGTFRIEESGKDAVHVVDAHEHKASTVAPSGRPSNETK